MKFVTVVASLLLSISAFAGKHIPATEFQDQPWWFEENQQPKNDPKEQYPDCHPLEVTENKNGECVPPQYEEQDDRNQYEEEKPEYKWEEGQPEDPYISEWK